MLRRIKAAYAIYNFFQRKKLIHNRDLYRKLGVRKSYFSPVSSKDFKNVDPTSLEVDFPVKPLPATSIYQQATASVRQSLDAYAENGFAILESYLSESVVDQVNKEIDSMLKNGEVGFNAQDKIMFAIHKSALLRNIGANSELLELLNTLLKGEACLFQSINFIKGSEQKTHSDSIHMTTFPLGGLLGVWIALEDIHLENGPLHYYPGSHKLPYYMNSDYDNEGSFLMIGDKSYSEYEKMLERKIAEQPIEKKIFQAKKGDVLIWHANLLHGGEPHLDKTTTRKSVVFHYFKKHSICYHEITQRPAIIEQV